MVRQLWIQKTNGLFKIIKNPPPGSFSFYRTNPFNPYDKKEDIYQIKLREGTFFAKHMYIIDDGQKIPILKTIDDFPIKLEF